MAKVKADAGLAEAALAEAVAGVASEEAEALAEAEADSRIVSKSTTLQIVWEIFCILIYIIYLCRQICI